MEPKLPSPERQQDSRSVSPEFNKESFNRSLDQEATHEKGIEQPTERHEGAPQPQQSIPSTSVLPIPVVPVTTAPDDGAAQTNSQDDIPATANDTELIEKEWVDKAKKVIAETKDDPFRREQEVNRLQAEYLFKRYGRKLGSSQ